MRKLKLLIAACALLLGAGQTWADVSWTDKTSVITNPSFETDNAISDLTSCGWATDRVTGWTISPASASNAQIGVGNSSSTIQGIGASFSPSAGEKYFYTRNNWNANTNFSISQTISSNLPAGLYKLTCKAATYSSNAAFNTLTLGLKEGTGSAVTHDGIILNVWNTWGVIIYKRADETNLTIEVNFKPGYDGGGKHYALLMDDFHLEFISETDAFTASSSNPIDFSDIINNAGIYNHSTKGTCPRGWTASKHTTGNGNYTEGEYGDTRFEGWSGGNLDIDYNQTITNLPAGIYSVTANAHERAEVGRTYVYASTEGQDDATGLVNSAEDLDITTSGLIVSNGTMKIGIRSTANDWVTADDFRISFLGFDVDAVKADYETAYFNATTARDAADNANIVGTERTTFEGVINTYTTDATQSYSWYVGAKEALENATTAFIAVRDSYDALAHEITKATALGVDPATISTYTAGSSTTAAIALTNTQNLKVAEYECVVTNFPQDFTSTYLATPTTNNFGSTTGQHWSGDGLRSYFDSWNGSAADKELTYTITLPVGRYVIMAAGRGQDNSPSTLYISDGTNNEYFSMKGDVGLGINKKGEASFNPDDSEGFANGNNGRGWEWRYLLFDLTETTEVTISLKGHIGNSWIGACDFALLTTADNAAINKAAYEIALSSAQAAIADAAYSNVTGQERTDLEEEIGKDEPTTAQGYDDATAALTALTSAFTAAKVVYDAYAEIRSVAVALSVTPGDTPANAAAAPAATHALNVAVYNATTAYYDVTEKYNPSWSDMTTSSGQHWSGDANIAYADNWSSGTNTTERTATVTLPAGQYILMSAGRGSSNTVTTMSANGTTVTFASNGDMGIGINKLGAASFDAEDAAGFSNKDGQAENTGTGWEWRYIPVALTAETDITVTQKLTRLSGSAWGSFSDFRILCDDVTYAPIVSNEFTAALTAAQAAPNEVSTLLTNIAKMENPSAADIKYQTVVTGSEAVAIAGAIQAASSVDATNITAVQAATAALTEATEAYNAAKPAYERAAMVMGIAKAAYQLSGVGEQTQNIIIGALQPMFYNIVNGNMVPNTSTTAAAIEAEANNQITFLMQQALTYQTHILGFEDGQYAPYNNAEGLELAVTATTMGAAPATVTNEQFYAQAVAMFNYSWTANEGDVDAIYNGMFSSDVEGDWGLTGWTRTNSWGQQQTGISGDFATAYYNQPGSLQYGNQGVYTMPLAAEQLYKLTFSYRSHDANNPNAGVTVSLLKGEEGSSVDFPANGSTTTWKTVTAYFKTGAAGKYVLTLANRGNTWMTNVSLVKASASVTATVTAAGMATLCSECPLDFTDKDVKAYTASLTGEEGNKTVLLTRVYKVPAGTGLVLKGAAADYEIPVIPTTEADAIEDNLMVGTLVETEVAASTEGSYNYMLANTNGVGFYNVAEATTSAAGKAYLHTTEPLRKENNGSRIALIFSDGEATGIATIGQAGNAENEKIYNLGGQRISKPSKGLYIVNGKKVIK